MNQSDFSRELGGGAPVRTVCLIGAECSGKTTLAQQLAAQCDGLWVPEVLRAFCAEQGRRPLQAEQDGLMRRHMAREKETLANARRQGCAWVVCDTAPLLTAIYSDYYFADTSLYQEALQWHARYELTLLLAPDIPWEPDGLQRDGALARSQVHALVVQKLSQSQLPWQKIQGDQQQRLESALHALGVLQPRHSRKGWNSERT